MSNILFFYFVFIISLIKKLVSNKKLINNKIKLIIINDKISKIISYIKNNILYQIVYKK